MVGFASNLHPKRALKHTFNRMLPRTNEDTRWDCLVQATWKRLFKLPVVIARSSSPAWLTAHAVHHQYVNLRDVQCDLLSLSFK